MLGDRDVRNAPDAPDYPLLVEFTRDGRVLKNMIPASTLKDHGDSFNQGGEIGQPAPKVTKDHIYFYAPTNREAVMCNRNGAVLAYRSISDIVDKIISMEDGYQLARIHHVDFTDHCARTAPGQPQQSRLYARACPHQYPNWPSRPSSQDSQEWPTLVHRTQGQSVPITSRTARLCTANQPEHKSRCLSTPSRLTDRSVRERRQILWSVDVYSSYRKVTHCFREAPF